MNNLIYISGPMTGYDLFNYPAFDDAEIALREKGWNPINPAQIDRVFGFDEANPPEEITKQMLGEFLSRDIQAIAKCDSIFLLDGWQNSKGANIELRFAQLVKCKIYLQSEGYAEYTG